MSQPSKRRRSLKGPVGGKQSKESEVPPLTLVGVPQKHQANNCNIYVENLEQTHAVSMIALSVSVNTCQPYLVDVCRLCFPGVLNLSDSLTSCS